MALTSPQFLLFAIVVVFAFHALPMPGYRRSILTIANLVFLFSFVSTPSELLPLAVFLAVGYLALRTTTALRGAVAAVWIGVIIVLFVYLKRYAFVAALPGLPFPYLGIGLSYILFRVLQLVIDRKSGELTGALSARQFLDFTCNFLSFISGPIQRSDGFLSDQAQVLRPVDGALAYRAFARVALGYFKVIAVSACAHYVFENVSANLFGATTRASGQQIVADYAVAVVAYTAYLYYNFAGYMDIVVGLGWLLGMDLPENFDHPFRARNLFEFWARWHMTLSEWFKTYLFNPLLGALVSRMNSAATLPYLGVLAFFITFFVMGVWHGSTGVFVIYGLVMGAGVSINKVWQNTLTSRFGKKRYRSIGEHWLYAATARGVTCSFFAIAVTALWVDMSQLSVLAAHIGASGLLATFVALGVLGALVLPASDWCGARLGDLGKRAAPLLQAAPSRQLFLAAEILLIVAVNSFFHKAPEFVYKAF